VTGESAPADDIRALSNVDRNGASHHVRTGLPQRLFANLGRWIRVAVRQPRATLPPPSPRAIAAVIITLIVVVAAMFVLDLRATDWARGLPASVYEGFEAITDFGLSGWFLIPFGIVLLSLATVPTTTVSHATRAVVATLAVRFGFLFMAIGVPGLFVTLVKGMIGRARPYVGGHDDPFAYMPFVWRPEYASMPSGHAATVASAAVAIGTIWPRARGVMWLYAAVIMLSRVVVVVHHPSDVLAGALVGIVGALLVRRWFAARRLLFSAVDLHSFPGPSWKRLKAASREIAASWRTPRPAPAGRGGRG
jgi:undecaprenyl-diphosphatase